MEIGARQLCTVKHQLWFSALSQTNIKWFFGAKTDQVGQTKSIHFLGVTLIPLFWMLKEFSLVLESIHMLKSFRVVANGDRGTGQGSFGWGRSVPYFLRELFKVYLHL